MSHKTACYQRLLQPVNVYSGLVRNTAALYEGLCFYTLCEWIENIL